MLHTHLLPDPSFLNQRYCTKYDTFLTSGTFVLQSTAPKVARLEQDFRIVHPAEGLAEGDGLTGRRGVGHGRDNPAR